MSISLDLDRVRNQDKKEHNVDIKYYILTPFYFNSQFYFYSYKIEIAYCQTVALFPDVFLDNDEVDASSS